MTKRLLRLLCAVIDTLLLLVPVQLVTLGVMQLPAARADLLFRLLFAVYGTAMVMSFNGATLGKYVGKLTVVGREGEKPQLLLVGLRELIRCSYFIPYAGWALGLVSVILLLWRGTTLHDIVGRTDVIFRWEREDEGAER